ncbi:glycosyltransferase family 39 protein, partial [bacterium]|nr:glycosyltransferase family 39 protein [bacterium]
MFSNPLKLEIENFRYVFEPVKVNISLSNKVDAKDIIVCYDKMCAPAFGVKQSNVYFSIPAKNTKIDNIKISYTKDDGNFKNNIENILLYVGNKDYYYSKDDISKFKTDTFKVSTPKGEKTMMSLNLPKIQNYGGVLNHLVCAVLSFFYHFKNYILVYIFGFLLLYNRNYKIKNHYVLLGLIFFLGAFLRCVDLTYLPLWTSENYTKSVAIKSLLSCFQDPGNPPLFFVLEYFVSIIFSKSVLALRFLPLVFGILTPVSIYFLLQKASKNTALLGALIGAISMVGIFYSQDARCYSFCMLLSVLIVHLLLNYLENPNKKNLILYSIVAFICANTFYYLVILVFCSYLYGAYKLFKTNKKAFKYFSLANLIALLSFIPYFLIVQQSVISSGFNPGIEPFGLDTIKDTIRGYFSYFPLFV